MTSLAVTKNTFLGWESFDESAGSSETYVTLHDSIEQAESYRTKENNGQAQLISVFTECSTPNWDGYGANAVDRLTFNNAWNLLGELPVGVFPTPDIVSEPDGEIAIEWEGDNGSVFSISIGPVGRISYAGRFIEGDDVNKVRGVEHWHGRGIPRTLLEYISRAVF